MANLVNSLTISLAVFCMLNGSVLTQTTEQSKLVNCSAAIGSVNMTQLNGTWFEVARLPSASQCVQVQLKNLTSKILNMNVTMAKNLNALYMNVSMNSNVSVSDEIDVTAMKYGYNVTFAKQPQITFKLLNLTNDNNTLFVCGYTDATNAATSFGAIFTRTREQTQANIQSWWQSMGANYTNFNKTMSLVTQSKKCYTKNGASASVPALATIFTILFAILKFFN